VRRPARLRDFASPHGTVRHFLSARMIVTQRVA
jgi:hypothetical protein